MSQFKHAGNKLKTVYILSNLILKVIGVQYIFDSDLFLFTSNPYNERLKPVVKKLLRNVCIKAIWYNIVVNYISDLVPL